jgi:hypothetical protein
MLGRPLCGGALIALLQLQAAMLGFYNSCPTVKFPNTAELVRTANRFSAVMGEWV